MSKWTDVGDGIWTFEYVNGSNPINTSAVDIGDGSLMVISPGTGFEASDFDALDALGTVVALVSPGAFHHLGFPSWKTRYPDVPLYGPDSSIPHIAKQHPDLEAVQSLESLRAKLSEQFELGELDGCKHPDIFLALTRGGTTTWWTNEILTNAADYPSHFAFRWVFKLSGNHPGLLANTLTAWLIGADKKVVRSFYEGKLSSIPPQRLVPCHGDVTLDPELPTKIAAALAEKY